MQPGTRNPKPGTGPDTREVVLAADIGGTTVSAGIVGRDGAVLVQRQVPTYDRGGGGGVLESILALLEDIPWELPVPAAILGAGIGVPGNVDVAKGSIGGDIQNIPELKGVELGPLVAARLGVPVVVDNDVNVLALGELAYGAARGARNFILLCIGTGVGGGIVLNGQIVRGATGYGGEVGHMAVEPEGRPCFCGSRGCLKTYLSGPDLAAQAREALVVAPFPRYRELAGGDISAIRAEHVFQAAREGDPSAQVIVDRAARVLGIALGNLINALNPELILLGGGVMAAADMLLEPAREWARRYAFGAAFAAAKIALATFDKQSGIKGAAALFFAERAFSRGAGGGGKG
jgi:glucokinase